MYDASIFGLTSSMTSNYATVLGCCILAGGKASRAHGADKAQFLYQGKPFVQRIMTALSPEGERILSYNQNPEKLMKCLAPWAQDPAFPLKVMRDQVSDVGPMGGIYSVLTQCESQAILFTPCDLPFYHQSIAAVSRKFFTGIEDALVIMVRERIQPLCGIYTKSCLPALEQMIAEKNFRIRDLLNRLRVTYLAAEEHGLEEAWFTNINTLQEYETI